MRCEIPIPLTQNNLLLKSTIAKTGKDYEIGYWKLAIEIRKRNKHYVMGYTNRTQDGKYIIALDYDNLNPDMIIGEIQRIQEDHELSAFYIFRSSPNSYHAVCLDKMCFIDYLHLLRKTTVDELHIQIPMKFGKKVWTLRVTDKKDETKIGVKHICTMSRQGIREQSTAHANILNDLFKLGIKLQNPDHYQKAIFARYPI